MVHIIPFVAVSLGGMMQWVQSPRFLEQDTLHSLLSTGWFQEPVRACFKTKPK